MGYGNFNLSEVGRKFHDEKWGVLVHDETETEGTDPLGRRKIEGTDPSGGAENMRGQTLRAVMLTNAEFAWRFCFVSAIHLGIGR